MSGKVEAGVLVGDWPASQNSGCVATPWAKGAAEIDAENPHASTESCAAGYCGRSPSIGRPRENHQPRRFDGWKWRPDVCNGPDTAVLPPSTVGSATVTPTYDIV